MLDILFFYSVFLARQILDYNVLKAMTCFLFYAVLYCISSTLGLTKMLSKKQRKPLSISNQHWKLVLLNHSFYDFCVFTLCQINKLKVCCWIELPSKLLPYITCNYLISKPYFIPFLPSVKKYPFFSLNETCLSIESQFGFYFRL